jgi:hypothetical protein
MTKLQKSLLALGACSQAIEWAASFRSLAAAWRACERGNWMCWLVGRVSGEPGSAARQRLGLLLRETVTFADLAADAADAAAAKAAAATNAAKAAAAANAADLAANAANAADAAADYAAYAANAAVLAANAADLAADYAANAAAAAAGTDAAIYNDLRRKALARIADIVRRHYPKPPRIPR